MALVRGIAFLIIVVVAIAALSRTEKPLGGAVSDSCAPTETDVRQYWVAMRPGHTEQQAIAMAKDLARQQAELCRAERNAKPTPLPAELRQIVR